MGDGGASAHAELMKDRGSSRKDSSGPSASSSNKSLRIASWNVRTMYEAGKCAQITMEMKRYRLHIRGVSETRWIQSGQKHLSTGEQVLYSGRDDNHHSHGVGLILSKLAQKSLRGWEPHGERILMASFTTKNKNINMNILQMYAPTNEAEDDAKDDFYNRLQDIIEQLPKKDVNIVMGDANAKIGSDNTGYEFTMGCNGLGQMNENGERLANFCAFNSLVIGGSIFPHKRIHKATWVSPDGTTENQIDHFCMSRKFRRSLEDVAVCRGADVGSDHHMVLAKIKLRLKKQGTRPTSVRKRFQVNLLEGSTKDEFQLHLRNKFQSLGNLGEEADVEVHWSSVKEVITTACQDVLGIKKTEHKEWISKCSLDLINKRRELKEKINESRTRTSKVERQAQYRAAAREVKKSIKKDKEEFTKRLAEKAEKAATGGHMRVLYQTTKVLTGKYGKAELPVKDQDGKTIFGREAQADRWVEHFKNLLNRPPPTNVPEILPARKDLQISCDVPTKEEIVAAIKQLNIGKAAGPDLIPPEALKADVMGTADVLHPLFRKIWTQGTFPMDWKEGHLVKIPKKGDLSKCGNYRGITLLSVPGKVFNRVVLNRIKNATYPKLRDEQAGFRSNRSTTDQIATLRIIVEQSLEWNSPLIANFLDYEKAFDSVDRESLWKILRNHGIPEKIVNIIRNMYEGTSCKVVHEGQLSNCFDITTGVRQGCMLSPFLFILAVDWLMKESTKGGKNGIQWTPWTQLEDLDFADDLALLSHTHDQMQAKTSSLNDISASIGLKIHSGKSKVLRVGAPEREQIKIEDHALEEVESFCYLGSIIDKEGGTEAEIKARIGKAQGAFTSLGKLWRTKDVSLGTKVRIFNSNVKSILLYGCETWNASSSCIKKIQVFINKCLRRLLRIKWTDRIRNEEVWRRTRQTPIGDEIRKRRWKWIGHTLRKPANNITRKALDWNPQGKRSRGRPRGTWRRMRENDVLKSGQTWNNVKKLAQDREKWKEFVGGLYPGPG